MEIELYVLWAVVVVLVLAAVPYFRANSTWLTSAKTDLESSVEVQQEVQRRFGELRRNLVQTVMDAMSLLGIMLLIVYTLRWMVNGKDSLLAEERHHLLCIILWQTICCAFHIGLLKFGEREVLLIAYVFNFTTVYMTFTATVLNIEPFVLMGRYIGSFVFLDLRHAFCANLLFTARFLQLPCENPSCLVKEFAVLVTAMVAPWSMEYMIQKWMASLVAACQLDTALRAARAVISCEAELDAELRLRKVSAKLADLFQASAAQLEGTAFLELLEEDDHERFKAGLKLASDLAQQHGEPTSSNVNVSKRSGPHKDLELCVCSLPRRQGTRYLLALAEVRDGDPVDHPEEGLEGLGEPSAHLVAPRLTAQALATHSWATPAIPNCSSVWEVKVLLDEQSLEVHGLHIALNTNHWKRSRKTFLKECILPGVWDNFKRWIDHTLQGRPGPAPFIVPFALHRIMSGIACARNVELKRKVGSTGRNELSLRLRHIFVRRPVAACHKAGSERSRDTL